MASNSPRRRQLLEQAGLKIDKIINPDTDETPLKNELPLNYVRRMAQIKCDAVKKSSTDFVLAADTIVTRGRLILGKPDSKDMAKRYLNMLSGNRHRVITSVRLAHGGIIKARDVTTIVKMKHLSSNEIDCYLRGEEWIGKAGGYAIQGQAACFIPFISGSYTNVVGLPLTETINLLFGSGYSIEKKGFFNG